MEPDRQNLPDSKAARSIITTFNSGSLSAASHDSGDLSGPFQHGNSCVAFIHRGLLSLPLMLGLARAMRQIGADQCHVNMMAIFPYLAGQCAG